MPWGTSNRKATLPKDWDRIRKPVLDRCGHRCEYVRSGGRRCGSKATHVDHIVPASKGGTDDPSNLQGLCPFITAGNLRPKETRPRRRSVSP